MVPDSFAYLWDIVWIREEGRGQEEILSWDAVDSEGMRVTRESGGWRKGGRGLRWCLFPLLPPVDLVVLELTLGHACRGRELHGPSQAGGEGPDSWA